MYTRENWQPMIDAMATGKRIEIDEDIFDYFLEVLPPVFMGQTVELADGTSRKISYAFAEGAEPLTYFWRDNGKFFAERDLQSMNPRG